MKNMMKLRSSGARIITALFLLIALSVPVFALPEYDCASGKHQYTEIGQTPATAKTDGEVLYRCELCGREWADILFATEHIWGPWVIDLPATCTSPGERHRACTQGAAHDQYEQIPALGHDYKEEITKKPSCLEDGVKTFTCAHDPAHTYTEPIPALGHAFGEWFTETPAGEGTPGVEARICAHDKNHRETRDISPLPTPEQEPEPSPTPEPEPAPEPEEAQGFNTADIVIESVNVAILGTFSALIYPYAKWSLYIQKQRKISKQMNRLREVVAKRYDFK